MSKASVAVRCRKSDARMFNKERSVAQEMKMPNAPWLAEDESIVLHRCEPCQKDFTSRKSLLRHLRENQRHAVPSDVSSLSKCELCPKTFARPYDLKRHVREQHQGGKQQCPRCHKVLRPGAPHLDQSGIQCKMLELAAESNDTFSIDSSQLGTHPQQLFKDNLKAKDHFHDWFGQASFNVEGIESLTQSQEGDSMESSTNSSILSAPLTVPWTRHQESLASQHPLSQSATEITACSASSPTGDSDWKIWKGGRSRRQPRNKRPQSNDTDDVQLSSMLSTQTISDDSTAVSQSVCYNKYASLADISNFPAVDSSNDASPGLPEESLMIKEKKRIMPPRSLPCGICKKVFSAKEGQKMVDHLALHFKELKRLYRCVRCQISFSFKKDLERHLVLAKKGDCGFMFSHTSPCTGHHPPQTSEGSRESGKRVRLDLTDSDRFDFCFRIRHWEQAQQHALRLAIAQGVDMLSSTRKHCSVQLGVPEKDWESACVIKLSAPSYIRYEPEIPRFFLDSCVFTSSMANGLSRLEAELMRAVVNGNVDLLAYHLDAGVNLQCTDQYGLQPLHYAAIFGKRDTLKVLLEHGAAIASEDYQGRTPLTYAVSSAKQGNVEQLLSNGATVEMEHLRSASASGNKDITDTLLRHLMVDQIRVFPSFRWDVLLKDGVAHENVHMVDAILSNKHSFGLSLFSLDHLISFAASKSTTEMMSTLLHYGACVNGNVDDSAVVAAVDANQRSTLRFLLGRGAQIDLLDKQGRSALSAAAERGDEPMLKILLHNGANVNVRCEMPPLQAAARHNQIKAIKYLLSKGADVSHTDVEGRTALLHAVRNGHEASVKILLSKGAEIDDCKSATSSLRFAILTSSLSMVKVLLTQRKRTIKPSAAWFAWTKEFKEHVCDTLSDYQECNACHRRGRMSKSERIARAAKIDTMILLEIGLHDVEMGTS